MKKETYGVLLDFAFCVQSMAQALKPFEGKNGLYGYKDKSG